MSTGRSRIAQKEGVLALRGWGNDRRGCPQYDTDGKVKYTVRGDHRLVSVLTSGEHQWQA